MTEEEAGLAVGASSKVAYGALEYDSNDFNDSRPYDSPYSFGDDGWTLYSIREEVMTLT